MDFKCNKINDKIRPGGGMMRNYEKEVAWRKKKYNEIRANIDRKLAEDLREKLKEDKKTIAQWITEEATDYLQKNS